MAGYVLEKFKDMLERVNGGSLESLPRDYVIQRRTPVQNLRANCSKYGLKEMKNFRPVLDWLHARGNVVIHEAERRSARDVPDRSRLAQESVEIQGRVGDNGYEFFFDLDNPWLRQRSR
jgi:hypothetical protein